MENNIGADYIGKYCIVRGDRSGVFAGTVTARQGAEISALPHPMQSGGEDAEARELEQIARRVDARRERERQARRREMEDKQRTVAERKARQKGLLQLVVIQAGAGVLTGVLLSLYLLGLDVGVPWYVGALGVSAAMLIQQAAGRLTL